MVCHEVSNLRRDRRIVGDDMSAFVLDDHRVLEALSQQ
jgi:hypothetical protein